MKKLICSLLLCGLVLFFITYIPSGIEEQCLGLDFFNRTFCRLENDMSLFGNFTSIFLIFATVVFYKILLRYNKVKSKRLRIFAAIPSVLFSIFIIIGKCYSNNNVIMTFFESYYNIFMVIAEFITYAIFFYFIIAVLFKYIDGKKNAKVSKNKLLSFILYKHPFVSTFITSLIISLFYFIIFYPGVVAFDANWQLASYFRYRPFINHHPAMLTMVMGNLYRFGRFILDDNLGIAIFVFTQIIINSLIFAYSQKVLDKVNAPLLCRVINFAFLCFFPLWNINSVTYIKDTMYYLIFFLVFVYQYYHFLYNNDFSLLTISKLAIIYIVLYICRDNTGFYVGILSSLSILIYCAFKSRQATLKVLILPLVLIGFHLFYHNYFLPHFDVGEGLVREQLSIPLQQTARYLKYYPNDVTEEEKSKIENLFVIDINDIPKKYNPVRSDRVKEQIKNYPTKKELSNYFSAWFSMFLKHPDVYFDSFFNNTYGYYYSTQQSWIGEELGFYESTYRYEENGLKYKTNDVFTKAQTLLKRVANIISNSPLIGLLYSCSPYTWICLILFAYCLYKKSYSILVFSVPLVVTFLICLVSPVNGHMRYYQPIAIAVPTLISFTYVETKQKNN